MLTAFSSAKINLTLDVLYRREDGYHEIESIMQSIDLQDKLEISKRKDNEFHVTCDNPSVPDGPNNLAYKAADLLWKKAIGHNNNATGINIKIYKNIPAAAGLAGGSGNGAAVLLTANKLWDCCFSLEQLSAWGKDLGADIPFCLQGGTRMVKGIGEKVLETPPLTEAWFVLIKPPFSVSTPWVYGNLDLKKIKQRPDNESALKALYRGDIAGVVESMANVLEDVVVQKYPIINSMKKELITLGADKSLMSGSGPTVFGLFLDKEKAEYARNILAEKFDNSWLAGKATRAIFFPG